MAETTPAVRERPILFSAPMVRAILDGRKTQTRRVVKLPHENPLGAWEPTTLGGPGGGRTRDGHEVAPILALWHTRTGDCIGCPYGQPGDRLWVRETWIEYGDPGDGPRRKYRADCDADEARGLRWRPSILMPRIVSRLTLELTGIRVERVQDISEADAEAEGLTKRGLWWDVGADWQGDGIAENPVDAYRVVWDSLNAARGYGWNANPFVWVLEFRRLA